MCRVVCVCAQERRVGDWRDEVGADGYPGCRAASQKRTLVKSNELPCTFASSVVDGVHHGIGGVGEAVGGKDGGVSRRARSVGVSRKRLPPRPYHRRARCRGKRDGLPLLARGDDSVTCTARVSVAGSLPRHGVKTGSGSLLASSGCPATLPGLGRQVGPVCPTPPPRTCL